MERRRREVAAEQAVQLVAGQVLAAAQVAAAQDGRPADGQSVCRFGQLESYK